ncbi:MAG: LmbE family protein, partial [Daejeonella sp.]
FKFSIYNKEIIFDRELVYKFTDPVRGEVYQPLIIAPPATATLSEKAYVFAGNTPKTIQVQVKAFRDYTEGRLKPNVPPGWKVEPEQVPFTLSRKDGEQNIRFSITPSGAAAPGKLSFSIATIRQTYNRGIKVLSYDHIPQQTLFPLAETRLEKIDLKISGKRIGYVAGAGDLVPEALKQIGYNLTMLTENQALNENLSGFDAIITGVRAYNVNPKMALMHDKLMDYVENGGTLLVQYNVNNPLVTSNLGPYPFKISRDRVTDENAKVTFLNPAHPVLNYPNKITDKDFEGWVQERGLYFVSDIDARYTSILRMNDANDPPSDGSLIVADYGKGKFVYTSLAFFRELPAGVPGAYRLFVNLISQKKE